MSELTQRQKKEIATILNRRANEIALFSGDKRGEIPASVEYGLELEITRLRNLAEAVNPEPEEQP